MKHFKTFFYPHRPALTAILLCGSNWNHTERRKTLQEKDAFHAKFTDARKRAKAREKSSRKRRRSILNQESIPSLVLCGDWLSWPLISWFVLDCLVLMKTGSYRNTLERRVYVLEATYTRVRHIYLPTIYSCVTCRAFRGSRESPERPLQRQTQTKTNTGQAINTTWTQRKHTETVKESQADRATDVLSGPLETALEKAFKQVCNYKYSAVDDKCFFFLMRVIYALHVRGRWNGH